jgi:hypothetical protein
VLQGQLSVEKELFAELLSNFQYPAFTITHTNVPRENDWHAKGRIFASKVIFQQKAIVCGTCCHHHAKE